MLSHPSTLQNRAQWILILILGLLLALIGYGIVLQNGSLYSPDVEDHFVPQTMGAVVGEEGVTFRVWAPHAQAVYVEGTFNNWSPTAHPLKRDAQDNWSATIPQAQSGDRYKYLIVNETTGKTYRRIDPYARSVTNSVGTVIIEDPVFDWGPSTAFEPPPLNKMVIYEIHVGTFVDEPGGRPGTFTTALQKLDYLKDLGINTLKILPVGEFAGDYSWGYNPSHIFAVEEAYGGPQAFKAFVKAAHDRGLAVILDTVYNHLGPTDLDLWQFDGWSPHWNTGGIYFYNNWRARTQWAHTRPNFALPHVRQYFKDNVRLWFDDFHVDGLRWDSTVNMRTVDNGRGAILPDGISLMQEINDISHSYTPPKIMVAEDHRDNAWITQETGTGGIGFDTQWDPKFVHTIRDAIIPASDADRSMQKVKWSIARRYGPDVFERVIYTESHDEVANGSARVPEQIWLNHPESWESQKRSTMGSAIVWTAPGIPMMFQGQEFLEDRWFRDVDPLEWWRLEAYHGIHDLYRDLIHLRTNATGVTRGLTGYNLTVHHVDNANKIVAYHRWDQGGPWDDVITVVNMTRQPWTNYDIGFPRSGTWHVRFNSDWEGYSPDFGNHPSPDVEAVAGALDGMGYHGSVSIGPWSALILSQDPE